jgi:hypothetical protein
MQQRTVLTALLLLSGILTAALGESIITLKSGEVLKGDVVSDTNDVLQIRAFSANRTVSSLRYIPHTDIQTIQTETAAQAAERVASFALSKFQLNPDQEQSTDFYAQWIATFEKFLTDYPDSDKAPIVQGHLETCRTELKHVTAGEVKFEDRWMTPVEKRPLSLKKQLLSLKKQLADLQRQEALLIATLQQREGDHWKLSQEQINSTGHAYDVVVAKENDLTFLVSKVQGEYDSAQSLATQAIDSQKSSQTSTSPPPESVVAIGVAPTGLAHEPWISQHWKGLAIGGGMLLLISLVGAYSVRRIMQKLEQIETARNEQRRVAREKLKKVFERIFMEGERPKGQNVPEGEVIPIGKGEDAYGGGRWFVDGDSDIWAVQNNGRDDDNWVYNNVITKGHGAVGARIPMDTELADYIKTEANAQAS